MKIKITHHKKVRDTQLPCHNIFDIEILNNEKIAKLIQAATKALFKYGEK